MPAKTDRLGEYRAKRDFSSTPEPAGGKGSRRKAGGRRRRSFCVQKHLATRLHYDFRLEHDGVLLSWAVPKGPSLNPSYKRLAMRTEDHPLEYGHFEGVIPDGYGAGIVMLWDEGEWTPLDDDVDDGLRRGNLKFELDGVKLKGAWALVRTGGRGDAGGREQWLLIKKRDHWSGDVDITALAPRSVKSRRDFEEILTKEKPDIWKSDKTAKSDATSAISLRKIAKRLAKLQETEKPKAKRSVTSRRTTAKKTRTSKRKSAARKKR